MRKTVDNNDSLKIVDYLDGFQYAGSVLQFFPTSEGYVKATPTDRINSDYHFNYIYNYTDHLGNVRLSYTLDPQARTLKIVDEHHYYPFGLRHEIHYPSSRSRDFRAAEGLNGGQVGDPVELVNVTETEYMYKYNGFEYQDELGLNWYDYMARNYDPALGRWMNIDPLAEMSRKTSPYVYALNNPVFFIDPDGMMAEASSDKSGSDGANSDNYSGMTTGVKLAFGVSLDSVINSGAAVSFYGNLQSTGRKEAEAERFASNIDTGDPKSGGNGNNTSESKNHGATIATSTYSALGEHGQKSLESGEYIQTNGKKGNFNDRPYNRLSRNGKAHFDRAKGLSKLRLLGAVGNIYSFGDGVWKDYNSFANGEPSIENTAVASGGILGGIVVGAAAGGGTSLMTGNPYVITGFTIVGGILGSFLGEDAVRELFNNSYDYNNGTPFIHKR